jgi:hypothetical protein
LQHILLEGFVLQKVLVYLLRAGRHEDLLFKFRVMFGMIESFTYWTSEWLAIDSKCALRGSSWI